MPLEVVLYLYVTDSPSEISAGVLDQFIGLVLGGARITLRFAKEGLKTAFESILIDTSINSPST